MSRIQVMPTKQAFVIIPRKVFLAMGWSKGDDLSWEVLGRDKLKVERKKPSHENGRGVIL